MVCDPNTYSFFGYFCIEQNVNISTFVAIALFFLGYVITRIVDRYNKKAIRKKYIVALLQEIELNIETLKKNLDDFPSSAALEEFIKKGLPNIHNRPLMTVAYKNVIFKSNTEILQDLEDILIREIIQFYGELDTLKTDVGSIEYKSFETISLESRNALFAHLRSSMENGITQGKGACIGIALYLRLARR